ncbi:MAG: pyridoxamine 5'-phosphate oxidase family protein [Bifidobacteriaceae bacterium]|jgi:nitroimidazol reductase NimA-like FMN-containing flavoprotein (pyridoxamine 5'-phosphate oxidase superfamily)|nr:pyridoxamine 5'-phosphate oxidase family protein [Bifidobacteriaceae bacterium]
MSETERETPGGGNGPALDQDQSQGMRRHDREIADPAEVDAILGRCEIGRLGLYSRGEPYVLPLHFAHRRVEAGLEVYFHGTGEGRKIEAIGNGVRACFEADRRIALVDNAKACRIGAAFESVIGWGRLAACDDPGLAHAGLVALLDKYAPGRSHELTERDVKLVTVLRMVLDQVTAKQRLAP